MNTLKMARFIENRRKLMNVTRNDLAIAMGTSARAYNYKLANNGFNEPELMAAARVLQFDVVLLPKEADIFTAGMTN